MYKIIAAEFRMALLILFSYQRNDTLLTPQILSIEALFLLKVLLNNVIEIPISITEFSQISNDLTYLRSVKNMFARREIRTCTYRSQSRNITLTSPTRCNKTHDTYGKFQDFFNCIIRKY